MLNQAQKLRKVAMDDAIVNTVRNIRHRIIVLSGKGGVGKTTISVNLAMLLQKRGRRTGLLDADITGPNVPKMLGLAGKLHIHEGKISPLICDDVRVISVANMVGEGQPVLWRGPMRSKLLHQVLADVSWGHLDYLVADLPPGTGDEVITMSQRMEPDLAIIVTTPQEVSLIDSARAINMAGKMNISHVALIENMSGMMCPACGARIDVFGSGGGLRQARKMKVTFLGALPLDIKVRTTADNGEPIVTAHGDSDIARAMDEIVVRIEDILEPDVRYLPASGTET